MLIEEKNGLNVILTEEREKLLNLMSVKVSLLLQTSGPGCLTCIYLLSRMIFQRKGSRC